MPAPARPERGAGVVTAWLAVAFVVVCFAPLATARTLVLDPAAGPYRTFAACLSQAAFGDTIEVAPGVYTEGMEPTVSVTIRSRSGPETTILDGEGARRIVAAQFQHLVFEGLTFRNGRGAGGGGAIQILGQLELRNCILRNNRGAGPRSKGGAVRIRGLCIIDHCRFVDNYVDSPGEPYYPEGRGGAIYSSGSLAIDHSTFLGNEADSSSAVDTPWELTIRRSLFVEDHDAVNSFFARAESTKLECNLLWPGRSPILELRRAENYEGALVVDPRICLDDPEAIHQSSPALLASGCDRIGELPVGCAGQEVFAVRPEQLPRSPRAPLWIFGYGLEEVSAVTLLGPAGQELSGAELIRGDVWIRATFDLSEATPGDWQARLESPTGPVTLPDPLSIPITQIYGFLEGWIAEAARDSAGVAALCGRHLDEVAALSLRSQADSSLVSMEILNQEDPDTLFASLTLPAAPGGLHDLIARTDRGEEIVVRSALYLGDPPILRVPEDVLTIGAAIERAAPGTEIRVAAGIWGESLRIDKPLRLVGASRYPPTELRPGDSARALHITSEAGPLSHVQSIWVRGGSAQDGPGGGICCESPTRLIYCQVAGSSARGRSSRGGGIFGVPGTRLESCQVTGCEATSGVAPVAPWSTDPEAGGLGGLVYCRDCAIRGGYYHGGTDPAFVASGRISRASVDFGSRALLRGDIEGNRFETVTSGGFPQAELLIDGPSVFRDNHVCVWDGEWASAGHVTFRGSSDVSRNAFNFVTVDVCPSIDRAVEPGPGRMRVTSNRLDAAEMVVRVAGAGGDACVPVGSPLPPEPMPPESLTVRCNSEAVFLQTAEGIVPCDTCLAHPGIDCSELDGVEGLWCVFGPVFLLERGVDTRGESARLWWRVNADLTLLGYKIVRSLDGVDTLLTPSPLEGCHDCEFLDDDPPRGVPVAYRLGILTSDAGEEWYELGTWTAPEPGRRLALLDPRPHPFRPGGVLRFELDRGATDVRLEIFDLTGRLVARPWTGPLASGRHDVTWDRRSTLGQEVPAGVYQLRVSAGFRAATRKILVLP